MSYPPKYYSTFTRWQMMDIIVGGGKYGCEAIEFLRESNKGFVLVDIDPYCLAVKRYKIKPSSGIGTESEYFVQGNLTTVMQLIEQLKPDYLFPTAPIHIAAELAKSKFELLPWIEAISCILSSLPPSVILRAGRGNLVVSYNRDYDCIDKCKAPEICPSTLLRKPCSMEKLMKFACPDGIFLTSYQMAPGMGALKGTEILDLFSKIKNRDEFVIATACDCHGCFSSFKKN